MNIFILYLDDFCYMYELQTYLNFISSPVKVLPYGLKTGDASYPPKYTIPPAPVGPGLQNADPYVNIITSSGCNLVNNLLHSLLEPIFQP